MNKAIPLILVVDDAPDNLLLASNLLTPHYRVKLAAFGALALEIAQVETPDLILLDVMMPDMNGYETCVKIKQHPMLRRIPVIFLTALGEVTDQERGFALGAVDYIVKPFTPSLLLARVKTHLSLKQAQSSLQERNEHLEAEIAKRVGEIGKLQQVAIMALASLAETRDCETEAHIQRTTEYVRVLAAQLQAQAMFSEELTSENIDLMVKSAPLHDIGKVGVPDMILWKPAKLNSEEFELVKRHPAIGRRAIEGAERLLATPESFLRFAKEMTYLHHERWDGSGYPEHLAREAIPMSARLMALADVYDALISRRVYKKPLPHAEAVRVITEESGKHFDPVVVEAFLVVAEQFHVIAQKYPD
jgi:putative two-component system response regulator